MAKQIIVFITRWAANGLGLWVAFSLGIINVNGDLRGYIVGALFLALLNAVIKPLIIVFTLPLIEFTLGFFLIVINGLVIYLLSIIYNGLQIDDFLRAMLAGIIIGLVNYIVTILFERLDKK